MLIYSLYTFHCRQWLYFPHPVVIFCYSARFRHNSALGENCVYRIISLQTAKVKQKDSRGKCNDDSVCVTEGTEIKNSGPYLIQSTSDSISMPNKQSVTILKYPGIMNLVTCESENSHLLWFRFVSTWLGSILQINNKLLNKPDFPAKFTLFFLLFLLAWCTIPWCISTKLTVITGGYYPKLKQLFSSENQYKISGWLWNTSLYLVTDFCLLVSLLQLFLLKRNLVAHCCLKPVSNFKVTGNNFRSWEKQSLGQLHEPTKWYRA